MSAFAAAVGALFADPNIGRDAVYIADGGASVAADQDVSFSQVSDTDSGRQAAPAPEAPPAAPLLAHQFQKMTTVVASFPPTIHARPAPRPSR